MTNEKPIIICLTPVKNEAWILDKFLQCTSVWADHIIIADQNSTDGSKEIAQTYDKVILIENNNPEYNEPQRQTLLINEARKIPGKRLLITLDADEFFTADFKNTENWTQMLNSKPGDVFGFHWINLLPDFKKAWISDGCFPWAFMDDNSPHSGEPIHSPRVPLKSWTEIIPMKQIRVLHYQYIHWKRMQDKHVYYQCLERVKFPHKSAVEIYRMYHHMNGIPKNKLVNISDSWFLIYEDFGIKMREIELNSSNWFIAEAQKMIEAYGRKTFKKDAIWENTQLSPDPRNFLDKTIHFWLRKTMMHANSKIVKKIDNLLKKVF